MPNKFRDKMGYANRSTSFCVSNLREEIHNDIILSSAFSASSRVIPSRRRPAHSSFAGLPPIYELPKEEKKEFLRLNEVYSKPSTVPLRSIKSINMETNNDMMQQSTSSSPLPTTTTSSTSVPSPPRSDSVCSEAGSLPRNDFAEIHHMGSKNVPSRSRSPYMNREIALSAETLYNSDKWDEEKNGPIVEYEVPEARSKVIWRFMVHHKYRVISFAVSVAIFTFLMIFLLDEFVITVNKKKH